MSETVISVQNISKLYRLGEVGTGTLSHDFNRWWHKLRGREDPYQKIAESNDRTVKGSSDYVWALKDISFDVKRGEVLGIIGRNGAGKSTLLKILSRVTTPSSGNVKVKGRIASLLEVGTGFNPELTGRENIYLNGAILGMRKSEIDTKFDEIVAFAEVDRYIDTPVKRYSSGMYVRLAFAVAAHLEPEILIIDEVLAVGDAEFQKKCIGKMDEVSKTGRTVVFVSHQMGMIVQLCNSCILMEKGRVETLGDTETVLYTYLNRQAIKSAAYHCDEKKVIDKNAYIIYQRLVNEDGDEISEITNESPIILETRIKVDKFQDSLELSLSLQNKIKGRIFTINTPIRDVMGINEKEKTIRIEIPANFIAPNQYSWISALHIPGSQFIDLLLDECEFFIRDFGSKFARYDGSDYGCIILDQYNLSAFN